MSAAVQFESRSSQRVVKLGSPRARLALAAALALAGVASARAVAPTFVWARTFGGSAGDDTAEGVATGPGGDVYASGEFYGTVDFDPTAGVDSHTSAGNSDIFESHFLLNGSYAGVTTLGGANFDLGPEVAVDPNGNRYYAGRFNGTIDFDPTAGVDSHTATANSYDAFVTRINADGSYGWTRHFGGNQTEEIRAISVNSAGDVVVAGYFDSPSADFDPGPGVDVRVLNGTMEDVFVTKFYADGTYAWTRTLGSISGDIAYGVAVDGQGNVVVCGSFRGTVDFDPGPGSDTRTSVSGSSDIFVTRFGADGSYAWTYTVGAAGDDKANGVAIAPDSSVLVTGQFAGSIDFDPGSSVDTHTSAGSWDVFVTRLMANGAYVWTRHFGANQDDFGNAIAVDANSNVLVAGRFQGSFDFDPGSGVDNRSSNGSADAFVSTFNLAGAYGGAYTFGGSGSESAFAVATDLGGNAFAAGNFQQSVDFDAGSGTDIHTASGSGRDAFILKLHYANVETPGACCIGGSCSFLTPSACATGAGNYQGPFVLCQNVACGGACCVNLQCQITTASQCSTLGGTFQGLGSPCDVDLCGSGPAGGWSTYRHDAQRSGRTAAVVPDLPNRVWSLLLGSVPASVFGSTIGPDGTIYLGLVAVAPDGIFRWQVMGTARAPGAIRRDGNIFLSRDTLFTKLDHGNGGVLCSATTYSAFPAAMDANGNSYVASPGSPWTLRKIGPSCNVVWSYSGTDAAASGTAIGLDGGIHFSGPSRYAKLDPADGLLLWSVPTDTAVGAPAIAPDGTIYHTIQPEQLVALNPDGTQRWLHTLSTTGVTLSTQPPAVGADGTIYVSGRQTYAGQHVLVAITSNEVEQWTFSEPITGGTDPISPVVDGAGKVLFAVENRVIAVSAADGAEFWRVNVGNGDLVIASPTIDEDGTLYVNTYNGYLIAFKTGCPESPPQMPPYVFRRVASEGDTINELHIDQLKTFELGADGLVSFVAQAGQYDAVFTETPEGEIASITHGDMLDGQVIDSVVQPRRDSQGRTYMPAMVADLGPAIFVENELFLSLAPAPLSLGPTVLDTIAGNFFDIDQAGNFLLAGKITPQSPYSAIRVRSVDNHAAENLLSVGTTLDALASFSMVGTLSPKNRRQHNTSGAFVLADYEHGVMDSGVVIARDNDTVGGFVLHDFNQPQVNASGLVSFLV